MGSGSSKDKKASQKSDALQQQLEAQRNDSSPTKQEVRRSIASHESSTKRSRSVAPPSHAIGGPANGDDWDYNAGMKAVDVDRAGASPNRGSPRPLGANLPGTDS